MGSLMDPKFTRSDALCKAMSFSSARAFNVLVIVVAFCAAKGRSLIARSMYRYRFSTTVERSKDLVDMGDIDMPVCGRLTSDGMPAI